MSIDTLPIIDDTSAKLIVRERVEITFKSGKKSLAYVAGMTHDNKLIYDCDAVKIAGKLYIDPMHQVHIALREIKSYIPLRPLVEVVK